MSFVRVRDHALWADDIYGNTPLQQRIIAMKAGDYIDLEVEGFRARWQKLPVRPAASARHGVKASGEAQRLWHALRDERHAGIVSIRACD